MTQQFPKQSLLEVLTAYKDDQNPLTTLQLLTTMATASLYAIRQKTTPADQAVWLTYENDDGHKELVTFTEEAQANTYIDESQNVTVEQVTFKQIALMVLAKDNLINSFIVNPNTTKAKFNQDIIQKIWQYAIKHV
ncbi:SseB family protein [Aerococcus urinaeequi]|uniref:SseB protein N-terminal domain-containing protein n=1 Tax=Aerococcus viridans TaxID=1377 RepID=A0A2N6UGI0_9LACT|nr:SseB family protein [Aerococcus viridans]PMC80673.1 hypothetical protein CJ191_00705 [Aerococcus viridans]